MPDTRYRRGRAYSADMAVYARSMASDNSAQLDRVKRNLVRALREDVTARQREFLLLYPEAPEAAAVTEIPAASDSFGTVEAPDALVEAPPTERSVAGVSAAQAGGAASGASVPDAAPEPETAETHPAQEQDAPTALLSGRHYVVLGVFSTEENARRAVRETEARESALRCRIYRFGGKFMVSPFSSDDAGACAQFIRVQDGRFPDMWTYTAR